MGRAHAKRRSSRAGFRAAGRRVGSSSTPTPTNASANSAEHFRDCFFFAKRDEAKYADLVVVNHALFFLDLAVGGGLLPPYDVVVLDEAHQCERWATDALTAVLSGATIGRMLRKLRRVYELPAAFDAEFDAGVARLESALARSARQIAIRSRQTKRPGRRSRHCASSSIAWKTGSLRTRRRAFKAKR